ncbi:hypothetical protein [Longimicrobium sp.]|uniref:hypothetical protein n=1 Tax=Longimicrobium sp. TaxID=2029185 RepID=UPI002CC0070A|nr:hypothetical protein [Longimicrobium sp.]HSU14933.1 hypothetical protein [Longimicrobium sp.]
MASPRKPVKLDDIPTLELESNIIDPMSDPNVNVQACYPNNCPPVTSWGWTCDETAA